MCVELLPRWQRKIRRIANWLFGAVCLVYCGVFRASVAAEECSHGRLVFIIRKIYMLRYTRGFAGWSGINYNLWLMMYEVCAVVSMCGFVGCIASHGDKATRRRIWWCGSQIAERNGPSQPGRVDELCQIIEMEWLCSVYFVSPAHWRIHCCTGIQGDAQKK